VEDTLRLMCVLAHPDDESLALGGILAKYAAEGVKTALVLGTRGERGWSSDWRDYPGERGLGAIREREVYDASRALHIARLDFLNYIDGSLDKADECEAVARIVQLLRLIRPHVVVTFGPDGLYGHPDHIAISQFTTAAIVCAADPGYPFAAHLTPHRVAKLYYRVASAAWFRLYMPIFGELLMHIDGQERRAHPWVNWVITTRVDTTAYWSDVWQAVRCHQTQIPAASILDSIPESVHEQLWGPQEFYRAFSLVNGGRQEEHDLFAGLRTFVRSPLLSLSSV